MSNSRHGRKFVFGPVPSRRLGRSLGVDLVPFKHCAYNCVYCQIGNCNDVTIDRSVFVPADVVLEQVREKLESGAAPDVITMSGSGEPTLHRDIGEVIGGIKLMTDTPVVVLTNGALLHMPDVGKGLLAADVVAPSLDAGTAETWRKVNRPHPSLDFESMARGIKLFSDEYEGRLLLEVFLAEGLNDSPDEVRRIAAIARDIKPERVQLNTVARPPAEPDTRAVPLSRLRELALLFDPPAEVIAAYRGKEGKGAGQERAAGGDRAPEVREMLERRPCTFGDIMAGMAITREELDPALESLLAGGRIATRNQDGRVYYYAAAGED